MVFVNYLCQVGKVGHLLKLYLLWQIAQDIMVCIIAWFDSNSFESSSIYNIGSA